MAALLEFDAKQVLARYGVAVPEGRACSSAEDAMLAATTVNGPVVVKALVPSKGKQSAGGVLFADTPAQALDAARRLLGTLIAGFLVSQVLVERRERVAREIYACVELDGEAKAYRLTVAANGGADVERELARGAGRALLFHPAAVPHLYQARDLLIACGIRGDALRSLPEAIVALCRAALETDATLFEVNPIGVRDDASACAVGVLASIDESALYRQPEVATHAVSHVDELLRPRTEWERRVDELNAALPDGGDIRFGEFPEGDIGLMVMGGGAGLMALDAVARSGGRPANFLDMTTAAGQAEEKVYRLTRLFLGVERLRGLFIGSNIGSFLPVPIRMRGIARALRETHASGRTMPVVVRLAGIADDEVAPIIEGLPVIYFRDEVTLEGAIDAFIRQVRTSS